MEHFEIVSELHRWLDEHKQPDERVVSEPHERARFELFMGEKRKRRGRSNHVSSADLLLLNERQRTVQLIVEVERSASGTRPKPIAGDVTATLLATNYTPSEEYGTGYRLQEALLVIVALVSDKDASQKRPQLLAVTENLRPLICLPPQFRGVEFCIAKDAEEAFQQFEELLGRATPAPQYRSSSLCSSG